MKRYSKESQAFIAAKLAEGRACDHPADQRHTVGLGIYCGKCRCRMDLVSQEPGSLSQEDGEQRMLDEMKKMYGDK